MADQPSIINLPNGLTVGTLTVNTKPGRAGDDQGIDRLSMLDFLRGKDGPWPGTGNERWVRYRGHHVERFVADPQGITFRLTYSDGQDRTTSDWFKARTTAIALLRDLDDVLDVVLDRWPLDAADQPPTDLGDDLRTWLTEAAYTHDALHMAWLNGHTTWLRELILEQTRRFDDARRAGLIPDRAEYAARKAPEQ